MIWHDVEQNTDLWLDIRPGKLTGSNASKIMANYGKAFGEPAKKLAVQIAVEQLTGKRSQNEAYSNAHMERGHEQESIARQLYEDEYFVDVKSGGFFDCGDTGCSPDGLVGDDGLIEIKSVLGHVHYATMMRNAVDPAYKWQVYFNLMETDREWIDFVSFCADFPRDKKLFIVRVNRKNSSEQFDMLYQRKYEFFKLVEQIKNNINGG